MNATSPDALSKVWLGPRARVPSILVNALFVLAMAVVFTGWLNSQAVKVSEQAGKSIEIMRQADLVLATLEQVNVAYNAYVLSGDQRLLEPWANSPDSIHNQIEALKKASGGNTPQLDVLARVEKAADELFKQVQADEPIKAGSIARSTMAGGAAEANGLIFNLRQLHGMFIENETKAFNTREKLSRARGWFGLLILGIMFAALAYLIARQTRLAAEGSNRLAQTNLELDERVRQRTTELEQEKDRVEMLLADVSHRVGNNLATVSSLLSMQARQSNSDAVRDALAAASERVQAIAAGQRRLRLNVETDAVDGRPYLEDVLAEIRQRAEGRPISFDMDIGDIQFDGRHAVSYVVLINELVTNALKHAFPDNLPGRIKVICTYADSGKSHIHIAVEDDGVGANAESSGGLGSRIVKGLLQSLSATQTTSAANPRAKRPGTKVVISVPTDGQTAKRTNAHEPESGHAVL